jgi:peptidoglycan/LPS O-acetylase OafA/YrhL
MIVLIINWNLNGNSNILGGVLDLMRYFILVTPFFCLLLVACSFGPTFLHFVLDRPLFHFLGEASFSLYITQSLILTLLPLLIKTDGSYKWLVGIGGIAVNILFAAFCYKYIETPARLLIRGNLKPAKNKVETVAINPTN